LDALIYAVVPPVFLRRRLVLALALALFVSLAALPSSVLAAAPTAAECVDAATQGQKFRDENKYIDAKSQFATCGADACPKSVKRQCLKWLEELDERMPSVVLAVRDSKGADVTDVTLTLDDKAIGSKVGEPFVIDPGQHTLRVLRNGKPVAEQKVVISAAEKNRILRIQLDESQQQQQQQPPSGPPLAPSSSTAHPPPPPPPPATHDVKQPSGLPVLPIVLAGVAVVGFAGFGYFGLTSRGDLSDLESSPCAATKTCSESEVSSIKTRLVLADVSLSVGIIALVTAAVSYFAMKPPTTSSTTTARSQLAR
jgi:hypothetical protein